MKRTAAFIALALTMSALTMAVGAPRKTHVVGSLCMPDGSSPSTATITVKLTKAIVVGDQSSPTTFYTIGPLEQTMTVTPDSVDIYLAPTTGSTPTGVHYGVTIATDAGSFETEWDVPDTTADTQISDIVVD